MKKVNIVLVEDEILIRQGIKSILEQEDHFNVIEEFGDGNSFVNYIESCNNLPDIVLMDIKIPGLNGVETTKLLCVKFPDLKIIALSSFNSEVFISNMLEAGAVCYIPKSASMEAMIDNINRVVINGFYYDDSIMNYVFDHTSKTRSVLDEDFLTGREGHVLKGICQQKSATEIGAELYISPRTVDGHRNNLLLKTGSKNIVGLVVFAVKHNLFNPEID
jgi:DNA-binding NarL/FixJ family response regulator